MLDFNHYDEVFAGIDKTVQALVKKAAFDIEAAAKGNAAVDTGFMHSSIYVKTEDSSDNSAGGAEAFPEVETPAHNEALIPVGAVYGVFVEYGTHKMGAQPFMTPAVEQVRQPFLDALRLVVGI